MALAQTSEQRFSHLLEPIRELAENWSIDIASELEDYLYELETLTISFEDGQKLDFAEAALLIQGSSAIYSKKVEHLHTLVYNTLNQLIDKKDEEKKRKKKEQTEGGAEDGDGAEDAEASDDEEFTTIAHKIKEEPDHKISLPPHQMLPAEEVDTRPFTKSQNVPLFLLMGDMNDEMKESDDLSGCYMNRCKIHDSGALLLPNVTYPEHFISALPVPEYAHPSSPSVSTKAMCDEACEADEAGARAMNHGDDDDNENHTFDMPDDDPVDMCEESWQEAVDAVDVLGPPLTETTGDEQQPPGTPRGWAQALADEEEGPAPPTPTPPTPQTPAPRTSAARTPVRQPVKPTFDPWAPLNPHDTSGAARRPFRKGRTYTKPPALADDAADDADDAKENGGVALHGSDMLRRLGLLCPASASATATAAGAASPTSVMVPLRAPLWEQFDSLHSAAAKQRAAARKLRRQEAAKRAHLLSSEVCATEAEEVEVEADALLGVPADFGGAHAAGGEAAGASVQPDSTFQEEYDDDMFGGGGNDDDEEEVPVDIVVGGESDGFGVSQLTQPTQQSPSIFNKARALSVANYHELCRQHVEECLAASESYSQDVDVYERVAEWQRKVEPILEDESKHTQFDIFEYADRLLAGFDASETDAHRGKKTKGEGGGEAASRPFAELANSTEKYEVARMFLATLQLTANGNVDLTARGDADSGDQTLTVNLIDRHRKEIEM